MTRGRAIVAEIEALLLKHRAEAPLMDALLTEVEALPAHRRAILGIKVADAARPLYELLNDVAG